jgi:hypothetical protein
MKEQIQDSLERVHADEEAYLNELITYMFKFQGYKYDQLNVKPIEVFVEIS